MTWIKYLAYGSNLHPVRLIERVPSAQLIGILPVSGYRLAFHKQGQDASGKCNLFSTGHIHDIVHCALYRMAAQHKPVIDRIEGKGRGYRDMPIAVHHNNVLHRCFAYTAQSGHIDDRLSPFHWYKELVLLGGEYHGLPRGYLDAIRRLESIDDPDQGRRKIHKDLIKRLRAANRAMKQP